MTRLGWLLELRYKIGKPPRIVAKYKGEKRNNSREFEIRGRRHPRYFSN